MPVDHSLPATEPRDEHRRVLREMDVQGWLGQRPQVPVERVIVRVAAAHDRRPLDEALVEDDDTPVVRRIGERPELEGRAEPPGGVERSERILAVTAERRGADQREELGPVVPSRRQRATALRGREVAVQEESERTAAGDAGEVAGGHDPSARDPSSLEGAQEGGLPGPGCPEQLDHACHRTSLARERRHRTRRLPTDGRGPRDAGGRSVTGSLDVALVLPSFGSGGAERVVLNLAGGLRARGADVRLLVLDTEGPLGAAVPDGVEVVDLHTPRARRAGPRLVAELRRRPTDILIGSQTHVNMLLALVRPLLPRRTRLVLREPNLRPASGRDPRADRRVGRLLGRADLVIASSEAMRAHLRTTVGARAPVHVLPNPVDVAGLRAEAAHGTPLGRPGGLVTVGRLTDQKGHADLVAALATALAVPHLTVLGDGPLRTTLEERAHALGVDRRVTFAGRIDDRTALTATVASAALLVHPAHFDGMPNAVLEALALGTPVLATTDLEVLRDLAEEVGPDALLLVPRAELAASLGEARGPALDAARPNLLPERFAVGAVVAALLDAVGHIGADAR